VAINIFPGDRIRVERDATGGIVTMGTVQHIEYRAGGQPRLVIVRETTRHSTNGALHSVDIHDLTTHLQAGMTIYNAYGDVLATI
jgi:hypothetical protein